jgi:hypothetical protein
MSSCEEMNKPLAGGGGMLMSPSLPPGGSIRTGGYGSRSFHAVHIGEATNYQKQLAERQAQATLKKSTVRSQIKERKVSYVAVPVKREKGQKSEGTAVMKVNASTGVPTGEVYATKGEGVVRDGDTIKLGGDPTLYFASTGGKL